MMKMRGISKSFGPTRALEQVSLDVQPGEVLALIGENGAGKSTLMKVLSGAHAPDSGRMEVDGKLYAPRGPLEARRAGIAMIYQELNLAPDLSVEDNIMLGQELARWGWVNRPSQRARVHAALETLGHPELQPDSHAGSLSVGAQQLVEIARALVHKAKIVVFDEPTSSLPRQDVEKLFAVIRKLRDAGLAVIYISHFLEEIREVADRYCVLRDGASVGAGRLDEVSDEEIVALIVGRTVTEQFPRVEHQIGEPLVELRSVSGERAPKEADLQICRGEILGIAGLVGAGRTELLRCLYGLDPVESGEIRIAGRRTRHSPRGRIVAGCGFLSEDRKSEGLAQNLSIVDNLTLSWLRPYRLGFWLRVALRRRSVEKWMTKLGVKAANADQEVSTLSGGNQQKVAFARVLHQEADILLLDEPTRGIDVGTKSEIYRLMGELAAEGKAVLFVSSYLPELLAVCDRVAVMARGRIRAVRPANEWTEEAAMSCAISGEGSELETPA